MKIRIASFLVKSALLFYNESDRGESVSLNFRPIYQKGRPQ